MPQGKIALQYGPELCAPDPKDDGSGRMHNRSDATSDTWENETDYFKLKINKTTLVKPST